MTSLNVCNLLVSFIVIIEYLTSLYDYPNAALILDIALIIISIFNIIVHNQLAYLLVLSLVLFLIWSRINSNPHPKGFLAKQKLIDSFILGVALSSLYV
jgi:hypothetical protein